MVLCLVMTISASVCNVYGRVPWPDCFDSEGAFPTEITGLGAICMAFLLIENVIKLKVLKRQEADEKSSINNEPTSVHRD